MFSPEATIQSARGSQRNPRRRQRVKDDSDLQQQPRPKRQKSTPNDAHLNGNGSVTMNGHARHSDVEKSVVPVDMPVRERKAPTKRALRDDSALYLVSPFRPARKLRC
jgi:nuclear pore complex protein Nup133